MLLDRDVLKLELSSHKIYRKNGGKFEIVFQSKVNLLKIYDFEYLKNISNYMVNDT